MKANILQDPQQSLVLPKSWNVPRKYPRRKSLIPYLLNSRLHCDRVDVTHYTGAFVVPYALIVLRESLSVPDPSWNKNIKDICRWSRITCHGSRVVGLTFNNASLTGTIPMEIGALTSLRSIEMYSNPSLYGSIPSSIGNLVSLEHFMVQDTSLAGTLPDAMGQLTNLEILLIEDTQLRGTVPSSVCELVTHHLLHQLIADSDKVECECCS